MNAFIIVFRKGFNGFNGLKGFKAYIIRNLVLGDHFLHVDCVEAPEGSVVGAYG